MECSISEEPLVKNTTKAGARGKRAPLTLTKSAHKIHHLRTGLSQSGVTGKREILQTGGARLVHHHRGREFKGGFVREKVKQ